MNTIGEKLKFLREKKSLTQSDVSDILNVQVTTLSRYENNRRVPDTPILSQLCQLYSCSADFILGLSDNPDPYAQKQDLHQFILSGKQLTYQGKPIRDEHRELLLDSIEHTLRIIEKTSR